MAPVAPTPPSPARPRSRSAAFTLIEVVVGGFITVLIMLSATAVLVQGMRQLRDARSITEVSQIVDSQYESLRRLNFATLVSTYGLSDTIDSNTTVDLTSSALGAGFTTPDDFSLKADFKTLAPVSGDDAFGLVEMTLTASWTSLTGREQRQVSYSCFGELGLSDYVVIGF